MPLNSYRPESHDLALDQLWRFRDNADLRLAKIERYYNDNISIKDIIRKIDAADLTSAEKNSLTGLGDCRLHYHKSTIQFGSLSPTFTGLTLTGLTADRLIQTNASKALTSVSDLTSWIAGTANRVTVSDDGDGSITLNLPQDIHTGASPTFDGMTLTDVLTTNSGRKKDTRRITGTTTLDADDHVVICDTDGGAFTVNLPQGVAGTEYIIVNSGTSGNDVTVDGNGAETINGDLTQPVSDGESMQIIFETTEGWRVI